MRAQSATAGAGALSQMAFGYDRMRTSGQVQTSTTPYSDYAFQGLGFALTNENSYLNKWLNGSNKDSGGSNQ